MKRALLIVTLAVLVFGVLLSIHLSKVRMEEEKRKEEERMASFLNNKPRIMQEIQDEIDSGSSYKALSLANSYKWADDEDVESLIPVINNNILNEKKQEAMQKAIQELIAGAGKISPNALDEQKKICDKLLELDPKNVHYRKRRDYYKKRIQSRNYKNEVARKREEETKRSEEERQKEIRYKASRKLELVSHRWSIGYGFATYEGEVKNISSSKLKNVQAVVTWYDKNDNMITSSTALIEYNPILSGQTSPFEVLETYNPAMETAKIEFSHFWGGTIGVYRKE